MVCPALAVYDDNPDFVALHPQLGLPLLDAKMSLVRFINPPLPDWLRSIPLRITVFTAVHRGGGDAGLVLGELESACRLGRRNW